LKITGKNSSFLIMPSIQNILESSGGKKDPVLIKKAYGLAEKAHSGQKRLSNDDYIIHPLNVACFLAKLGMDPSTIAAGLLHDVLEDTDVTVESVKKEFGDDVAFLVEGVTKLRKMTSAVKSDGLHQGHLESFKKMIFATAEDIRVILIKLADKHHNMETLGFMPKTDQKRIAVETLDVYAPIAARLGMGYLKGELEDLSFPYAYPKEYSWLKKKIKEKYANRISYIEKTKPIIKSRLKEAGVPVIDLHSRAKHYFSLYQKLKLKDMDLDKIHDLVAMRIIVPDIKSCYEALGVIHKFYKPLPGLIKDYIALPKPNGYQSLHTTIFCEKGRVVEIQIRTEHMHDYAENGIAAHWAYSESGKKTPVSANAKEIQWVSQLKKFLEESKTGDSFTNLKIDFFKNRIFTFTPKGDVKDLPEGATPIDFAYAVHTDIGHAVKGAKINGKIVPLGYELKNGDVVDIMKGKDKKPSFDWLKVVKTAFAKKAIASRLRELGDARVTKAVEEKSAKIKIKRVRDAVKVISAKNSEPLIAGQRGLLYKIAKCCNPESGHKIKGYMTLTKGVSIHSHKCANIKNAPEARLIDVSWDSKNNKPNGSPG